MLCTVCGADIPDTSVACPVCGHFPVSAPSPFPEVPVSSTTVDETDTALKGYLSYTSGDHPAIPERQQPVPEKGSDEDDDPVSRKNWMAYVSIIAGALSVYSAPMVFSGALLGVSAAVFGILGLFSRRKVISAVGIAAGAAGLALSLLFASIYMRFVNTIANYLMGGFGFGFFGGW